jgi:hypothetical protein
MTISCSEYYIGAKVHVHCACVMQHLQIFIIELPHLTMYFRLTCMHIIISYIIHKLTSDISYYMYRHEESLSPSVAKILIFRNFRKSARIATIKILQYRHSNIQAGDISYLVSRVECFIKNMNLRV